MPDNKTTKQIVPDMRGFDVGDVVSILMGGEPVSEVQVKDVEQQVEKESEG